MRVTSLGLKGFRSFESMERIGLGPINVLVGANNAGKSSILKALYSMQQGSDNWFADVRVGGTTAQIDIGLEDMSNVPLWGNLETGMLRINLSSNDRLSGGASWTIVKHDGSGQGVNALPGSDPHHFVVPYLSKRKTATYHEDVRNNHALQVTPNMHFLAAKLSRISNPSFPGHERYRDNCKAILGFMVTAVPSEGGQRPGIYLPNRETIPIDQMGEGVPNIVMLLADLALSDRKLFLIEEPENDLHPAALKALLELIIESSATNQFVISTHSNIVLRHLGSVPSSRVYEITAVAGRLPVEAKIRLVEPTVQARLDVLRDLGYSFSDFDLWDGWLFVEEASAERIIRDYLIPWFTPKLLRVRTLSAAGTFKVEPVFEDFHRLALFTHLERAYTNAAWVRVDGDEAGKTVVQRLRDRYPTWDPDRFACFSSAQFEHYYPAEFKQQVAEIFSIGDKQARREAKRLLLEDVRSWLDEDDQRGRAALALSAQEIISDLQKIATQLS